VVNFLLAKSNKCAIAAPILLGCIYLCTLIAKADPRKELVLIEEEFTTVTEQHTRLRRIPMSMYLERNSFPFGQLAVIALVATIVLVIVLISGGYQVNVATEAMMNRAQVSAEMSTMAQNLADVQQGMERYGMTSGYSATIFKTPGNDMALNYQAVVDLKERAESLSTVDQASVEYNVALDDMRGTIRELYIEAIYWWLIRNPLYWVAWGTALLFCYWGLRWLYQNS